jgi:hypothetical protein
VKNQLFFLWVKPGPRLPIAIMHSIIDASSAKFYRDNGYIIMRGVIPAPLIERLRAMAEEARAIAHRVSGPQAQRLQPLGDYLDVAALREFTQLPALTEAFRTVLSGRHYLSPAEEMTVLFQPSEHCWATEWHRDLRDHMDAATLTEVLGGRTWDELATNFSNFNQFNCALYEDTCTWFVPGSHVRMQDTPEELSAARAQGRADVENKQRLRSEAEQELFLNDYCRSMPGAVQVILQAGDLVLYRNTAWHTGNYVPYRRRATLHGQADTPEFAAYKRELTATLKRIDAAKSTR